MSHRGDSKTEDWVKHVGRKVRSSQHKVYSYSGELIVLPRRVAAFVCCDCGLVHIFRFRLKGKKITFRAWRKRDYETHKAASG